MMISTHFWRPDGSTIIDLWSKWSFGFKNISTRFIRPKDSSLDRQNDFSKILNFPIYNFFGTFRNFWPFQNFMSLENIFMRMLKNKYSRNAFCAIKANRYLIGTSGPGQIMNIDCLTQGYTFCPSSSSFSHGIEQWTPSQNILRDVSGNAWITHTKFSSDNNLEML